MPGAIAASLASSNRAKARSRSGASKSTTIISTMPSLRVCNCSRPSDFSAAPSRTVRAAASPTSRATAGG